MGIELRGSVLGIATIAGVVTALNWVCTLVVSPLAGRLCDRLGRRVPFLVATLLQGGASLCLAWMEQVLATVVFFTVFFICLNAQKVFLDAARGWRPGRRGKCGEPLQLLAGSGSAAGPLLGYGLAAVLSFAVVYLIGAGVLLGVGLLSLRAGKSRGVCDAA